MLTPIRSTNRLGAAVKGFALILAGFMLLPYSRLLVHGLTVLASEFDWAQRWERAARQGLRYDAWVSWRRRQKRALQWAIGILTIGAVATLWVSWVR